MSDLISRSALIAAFNKTVLPKEFRIVKTPEARMVVAAHGKLVKRLIDEAPAVDSVEVVRCKDCKHYKEGELLAPNKFCFRLMHPTENRHIGYNFSDNDFCSYGERKDNGSV